jgi:hypothetical protein
VLSMQVTTQQKTTNAKFLNVRLDQYVSIEILNVQRVDFHIKPQIAVALCESRPPRNSDV